MSLSFEWHRGAVSDRMEKCAVWGKGLVGDTSGSLPVAALRSWTFSSILTTCICRAGR